MSFSSTLVAVLNGLRVHGVPFSLEFSFHVNDSFSLGVSRPIAYFLLLFDERTNTKDK